MNLRAATTDDSDVLARAHATAFDASWTAPDIAALMRATGGFAILAQDKGGEATGFILGRALAGEAEILTLAVAPQARRSGLGRALVDALAAEARERGAKALFLEVAADNAGAIALYNATGFERAGMRRAYYARPGGPRMDALILRRPLNS
jgi:[ribosomal protein S18]-alanine N-acetyltransferase